MGWGDSKVNPSSRISQAIDQYFQYCHRQPIWCFEREEVKDPSYISEELVCSILTLTARFSQERDELQHYGDTARTLIMLRIANGSVELETLESMCLLSYSSFLGTYPTLTTSARANRIRWQHFSWALPPRPSSSTLSLCHAGRELNIWR